MSWLKVGDVVRDARPNKAEIKRLRLLDPSVMQKREFEVIFVFGSLVQVTGGTCHPARQCQRVSRGPATSVEGAELDDDGA